MTLLSVTPAKTVPTVEAIEKQTSLIEVLRNSGLHGSDLYHSEAQVQTAQDIPIETEPNAEDAEPDCAPSEVDDSEDATAPEGTDDSDECEPDEENENNENNGAYTGNSIRLIVTAEKTPEAANTVPISLTVLEQQEIEDADIGDFEDVARNTPNFSVFDGAGSRAFYSYSIRGLGNNNFLARDAVSFYVDDVPYDYGGFIGLDLNDLERVEVLRGPQSTLYGRSALSGVVNVVTQKPTNEPEFGIAARYGNFNDAEVQANASGPLIEDELFYRLSGSYAARDGYFDNTLLNDDLADSSGGQGRLQLRWQPTDNLEVDVSSNFSSYDEDGIPLVSIDDDPFTVDLSEGGFAELISNAQSVRVAYAQPDYRITSVSARRFSQSIQGADLDGGPAELGLFSSDFSSTVFTQEVRVQSPETAEKFQWTAGAYLEEREFITRGDGITFGADAADTFGFPAGTTNFRSSNTSERFWALFGQASYTPVEPLTLTAGLRYETFDSALNDFTELFSIPGLPAQTVAEFSKENQSGSGLLPMVAAEYRFSPDFMLYGSIARGYRPGGVNYRASNPETLTFESESTWNFELGAKSTWLDDRLGLNLSVFHSIVDNYQVQVPGPLLVTNEIANADARISGVEVETRVTPLDGLDIIAGFGYLDAEFSEFTNQFTGEDFTGNRLPLAPEFTYNLAMQYRSPAGFLGRVELQGTGLTFFEESNDFQQKAYAVVNARVGYEFDPISVYLFGNNIFDTTYLTQGADIGTGRVGQYGSPATFGVQVRSEF
ncbi:MAG: TonB-dependent receptor [Phormidesmis sp.]